MPLVETEAIVLKSYDLAEADKIVVMLTSDHGIVRAVAKGAKRLKSRFGSGLEPFSLIRVGYFEKEALELVSLDRSDLIRSNFREASDPDFLQKFSFLAEILISLSPPNDPNETLYRMVRACLDAAVGDASTTAISVYFEIWLLRLSGFLPEWRTCITCRQGLADDEDATFSADGHLLCPRCRRSAGGRGFTAAARRMVPLAMRSAPRDLPLLTASQGDAIHELSQTLRRMISSAIGRELAPEISLELRP